MNAPKSNQRNIMVLTIAGVLFALAVGIGLVPREEATRIGLIFFGFTAVLANLNRIAALSFSQFALLAMLFLHFLNVCRDMNIFINEPLFDAGRAPLSLAVGIPMMIVGWRGLLTGPGFAAISVPIIYLAWNLLASGFGLDPFHSYFYGSWLLFMCILISLARGLHRDPDSFWEQWLLGLSGLGALTSFVSIIAIIFDLPGARYQRLLIDFGTGVGATVPGFTGVFENPNTLSSTGMLGMAAAIGVTYLRGGRRPVWLEPTLAICTAAVLLSGSRAGIFGSVATFGSYLWLLRPMQPTQQQELTRLGARAYFLPPVLLLVGILAFSVSPVARVGMDRLFTTVDLERGAVRDEVWFSFVRGIRNRPLFGHGYMSKPMEDDWETQRVMPDQRAKSAHSAPLEYGATTGVIGLLLFLWMLWGGVKGLLRPGYKNLARSALAFWICSSPIYLLYAHGNSPSAPAVWPLLVLLLTCRSVNGQLDSATPAPPWVLRISRQEETEFRAALPPFSAENFGREQARIDAQAKSKERALQNEAQDRPDNQLSVPTSDSTNRSDNN